MKTIRLNTTLVVNMNQVKDKHTWVLGFFSFFGMLILYLAVKTGDLTIIEHSSPFDQLLYSKPEINRLVSANVGSVNVNQLRGGTNEANQGPPQFPSSLRPQSETPSNQQNGDKVDSLDSLLDENLKIKKDGILPNDMEELIAQVQGKGAAVPYNNPKFEMESSVESNSGTYDIPSDGSDGSDEESCWQTFDEQAQAESTLGNIDESVSSVLI